ncbi:hypothetical protein EVAR_48908_1 [Eumeta japonica]|uniref:Uncharacterized protein n=1 Tax=Eumeta variegata TaxID=151549 RepID=A0A4C1YYM8_EUMVA|nr:hypothetical protein EVAR_48908_1 [Eumeta japonica]
MRSVGTTALTQFMHLGAPRAPRLAALTWSPPQWAHFSDASLQKRLECPRLYSSVVTSSTGWHSRSFLARLLAHLCPLPTPIETVGDVLILGPQGLDDVLVRIDLEDVPDDDQHPLRRSSSSLLLIPGFS